VGWDTATPIMVRAALPGIVTVDRGGDDAEHKVTATMQIPIPVAVRRRVGLRVGDRVLLAAHPSHDRLIVLCQTALDTMLAEVRAVLEEAVR
jgi:bifunctional DNA-binding transcriptional regulator/antitoxin component of YhaV-PrlF toxin-antitoxin module